ncbi:MAG: hypothetical protein JSS14_25230 [Proteobacteria bacterium]|nr:hypothetical protein [Pseudomonadota bacterium]
MHLSVINRIRFTAWAWLASAFLLGLAVGGVGVAVPLWNRLQAALDDTARLQQVSNLVVQMDPGSDVQALASLETPSDPVPSRVPAQRSDLTGSPVIARAEAASPAPAPEPAPAPSAPLVVQQAPEKTLAPVAAQKAEAASKVTEALKAARAAEEAERKAKAERQAKAEREQKAAKAAAKAAQEALERQEREQVEALATAARPKAADQPVRKDSAGPVQIAAQVPVGGAGQNAPTERVTKDEAGLTEAQASGVTFKSGRRVAVGETFPSGEKLVSVNPAIGEIITSKRRIVLKASAAQAQ